MSLLEHYRREYNRGWAAVAEVAASAVRMAQENEGPNVKEWLEPFAVFWRAPADSPEQYEALLKLRKPCGNDDEDIVKRGAMVIAGDCLRITRKALEAEHGKRRVKWADICLNPTLNEDQMLANFHLLGKEVGKESRNA